METINTFKDLRIAALAFLVSAAFGANAAHAAPIGDSDAKALASTAAECTKDVRTILLRTTAADEKSDAINRLLSLKGSFVNDAEAFTLRADAARDLSDSELENISTCVANLVRLNTSSL